MASSSITSPSRPSEPSVDAAPERSAITVGQAVAGICARLLEALHAGAPGAELATLLDVAGSLLAAEDIVLMLDGERITANGTACHPETSAALRNTLRAHGVQRIVLTRATSARELLQVMALLVDPPQEATGAIANLWGTHGAWRIRLELTGETSARLLEHGTGLEVGAARDNTDETFDTVTSERALAELLEALEARRDGADQTAVKSSSFSAVATPQRVRAVAELVGRGVSFAPDQPLGRVLSGTQSEGTRALLACLATAPNAVVRRRYCDAIASLKHGVEDLIGSLEHETWYVVRNAAMLLGDMRARAADHGLARLLGHADARVRLAAAQSLAAIGTDVAVLALEAATRDSQAEVRVTAWSGLATSPDTPSLACFSDALTTEPDAQVQRALLSCLAEHPHPMAIALLVRFCARLVSSARHGGIVCDALELLAQYRPRSVRPFLRRLQDMDTPATRSRIDVLLHRCPEA